MVSEEKYDQLKVMGMNLKYFSTNPKDGWIQINSVNEFSIENVIKCNKAEPTIFILPSGNQHEKNHPKLFVVPYSSHSNYIELQTFVRAIMPFKLTFIVPYMTKGVPTQRGPEIFLKSYVRTKPMTETIKRDEVKEETKVTDQRKNLNDSKLIKKRRFQEANPSIFAHKGKRLKGATFVNSEAIYSLPSNN